MKKEDNTKLTVDEILEEIENCVRRSKSAA